MTGVLALSGLLLSFRLLPEREGSAVAWQDVSARVGSLKIARAERRVFADRKALAAYLRVYGQGRAAPKLDFRRRQFLLVTPGPRSSTGYGIDVIGVRDQGGRLVVKVRERTPQLGERVSARMTRPFRLLSLPAGEAVDVDWVGR